MIKKAWVEPSESPCDADEIRLVMEIERSICCRSEFECIAFKPEMYVFDSQGNPVGKCVSEGRAFSCPQDKLTATCIVPPCALLPGKYVVTFKDIEGCGIIEGQYCHLQEPGWIDVDWDELTINVRDCGCQPPPPNGNGNNGGDGNGSGDGDGEKKESKLPLYLLILLIVAGATMLIAGEVIER